MGSCNKCHVYWDKFHNGLGSKACEPCRNLKYIPDIFISVFEAQYWKVKKKTFVWLDVHMRSIHTNNNFDINYMHLNKSPFIPFDSELFKTNRVTDFQSFFLNGWRQTDPSSKSVKTIWESCIFEFWVLGKISPCSLKKLEGSYSLLFHISCCFHYIVINLTALLQLLIYVVSNDKRSNGYKFWSEKAVKWNCFSIFQPETCRIFFRTAKVYFLNY
jgi:hypothetical protein